MSRVVIFDEAGRNATATESSGDIRSRRPFAIPLITFRGLARRSSQVPVLHRQYTVQVSALPASQHTCCTGRACRSTDARTSPVFLSAVGTVAPPAIDLTSINDSEPPDRSSPIDSDLHSE